MNQNANTQIKGVGGPNQPSKLCIILETEEIVPTLEATTPTMMIKTQNDPWEKSSESTHFSK